MDDEYLNGYARLCGWKAALVYTALCRHAGKDQSCFPGIKLLSEKLGISEKSIKRGIRDLEKWNIIQVVRNRGRNGIWRNNTYILLDKSVWKAKPDLGKGWGKPAHQSSVSPVTGVRETSDRGTGGPHKETHRKEISKEIEDSTGDNSCGNPLVNSAMEILKGFSGLPSLNGT